MKARLRLGSVNDNDGTFHGDCTSGIHPSLSATSNSLHHEHKQFLLQLCAGIFAFGILSSAALDYGNGKIFDITHKITSRLPTFGSTTGLGQFMWLVTGIKNGSTANVSEFKLGTHTGTHVEAPSHFFQEYYEQGFDVTSLSLQTLNGNAFNFFISSRF
ncbi:Cyclase family protein isoform 1 [Hibiscus syriacus]|uniref:Cyclase family protein isoform 1 n=1 Tax=Hibiscus syriacus TaxID=106335 RepID=A0A6A3CGH1_HIBSY|nr:Cyclase family protein isoform 1 [Hibiscus syriacus]